MYIPLSKRYSCPKGIGPSKSEGKTLLCNGCILSIRSKITERERDPGPLTDRRSWTPCRSDLCGSKKKSSELCRNHGFNQNSGAGCNLLYYRIAHGTPEHVLVGVAVRGVPVAYCGRRRRRSCLRYDSGYLC